MYKALYRKYRPTTFSEVLGQDHITKTLQNQIMDSRSSHAYIFTGTRGTGKTSCAKILARAVNCTNLQNGDPCNTCEACLSIINESAVDVAEIDAASNNKIDDIRQILDETRYTPSFLSKRVYIIDEVHMLTSQAFNALLKTLEEPPSHVVFILATTEIHKVLPTILSRCQRFDFKRITLDDISKQLINVSAKEGISLEKNASEIISSLADGGLRDALSILDRCITSKDSTITSDIVCERVGVLDYSDLFLLANYILNSDTIKAVSKINDMYISGKELSSILEQLVSLFRDIILFSLDSTYITIYSNLDEFQDMSKTANSATLSKYIEIISKTLPTLAKSHSKKIDTEMCIIKLCNYLKLLENSEISDRLSILEDKITNFRPITEIPQNIDVKKVVDIEKTKKEIKKDSLQLIGKEDITKLANLLKNVKDSLPASKYNLLKNSTKILFSDIEILIYGEEYICTDIINFDTKSEIQNVARKIFNEDIIVKTIVSETKEKNDTNLIDDVLNKIQTTNITIKTLED